MGCKSLANKADCTTGSGALVLQTYAALIMPDIGNATGASLTLSNGLRLSNLSPDQAVATDSSKNLVSIPNTGTGNNVLQVSPTLVTPILGNATYTTLDAGTLLGKRRIVTYSATTNNEQFNGIGTIPEGQVYQVDATTASHIFYAATSSTTSNELFRVRGTGGFVVGGDSTFNGGVVVGGNSTFNGGVVVGGNSTFNGGVVVDGASTFNTSLTTPLINFGSFPFTYSRGVWTPVMRTLRGIGLAVDLEVIDWAAVEGPVEILTNNGYYTKIGSQVTVFYEVVTRFWGNGNDSFAYRTPIIQGLPFKCSTSGTPIKVRMAGVMDDAGFPNGYILGLPVPFLVTMDGGYTATVLEEGYVFETKAPPFYVNNKTWTADGYTMTINCAQSQYIVTLSGVTVLWSGLEGNLYNANVLLGSQYTARFVGSVTYFTDE